MPHPSMRFLAASLAATAACSPQANDEYLGEPLLRMRGQVSTQALATPQPIVPALCFFSEIEQEVLKRDVFPQEIQDALKNGTGFTPGTRLHVVDVQTLGQFPAEFKVDVYKRPPDAPFTSILSGEPRVAHGVVCAMQADHQSVPQWIGYDGHFLCDQPFPDGHCQFVDARRTEDGSRFFYEKRECPNFSAKREQCEILRGGDETLLSENSGYEDLVALAQGVQVVYLAEPAPAGSYTAYTLGAPNGLSAGYHVLKDPADEEVTAQHPARLAALQAAAAEINERFGTDYPFPFFRRTEVAVQDPELQRDVPPAHMREAYKRALARIEMETVPLLVHQELGPDDPGLTLDLKPSDATQPLPPPEYTQPSQ